MPSQGIKPSLGQCQSIGDMCCLILIRLLCDLIAKATLVIPDIIYLCALLPLRRAGDLLSLAWDAAVFQVGSLELRTANSSGDGTSTVQWFLTCELCEVFFFSISQFVDQLLINSTLSGCLFHVRTLRLLSLICYVLFVIFLY